MASAQAVHPADVTSQGGPFCCSRNPRLTTQMPAWSCLPLRARCQAPGPLAAAPLLSAREVASGPSPGLKLSLCSACHTCPTPGPQQGWWVRPWVAHTVLWGPVGTHQAVGAAQCSPSVRTVCQRQPWSPTIHLKNQCDPLKKELSCFHSCKRCPGAHSREQGSSAFNYKHLLTRWPQLLFLVDT